MTRGRRIALAAGAALFSAGWIWPAWGAADAFVAVLERWLWAIEHGEHMPLQAVSHFLGATLALAIASGWLGLVIASWAVVATWSLTRERR